MLSSLLKRFSLLRRFVTSLRYEMIYGAPGWRDVTTFNVGLFPTDPDIAADPATASEALQIQVYEEVYLRAQQIRPIWPGDTLAEIAAGRGGGLAHLARRAEWTCIGFDRSSAASRSARRRGVDIRRARAEDLPVADGSCAYAISVEGIFCCDDVVAAMTEAGRILAPDGCLVLAEFFSGPIAIASERIARRAAHSGLVVTSFVDLTPRARAAFLMDEPRRAGFAAALPRFLVDRFRETLGLEGTKRYAQWRDGHRSYFIATLARLGRADTGEMQLAATGS
ncbi:methyltransferase domain-containing protein [Methylobrevis pamukkalensis]|uniref:methyltransferase domain-containing protein n=1 Tax=Methylobrevis pamukkalensis TaxID=1439726 RepID=UPI00114D090F|nr:methyltransferase domain-containing protein [Methylobrevis pamukkalensis]